MKPTYIISVFISEVTARAYLVAEQHKRRTLAKADVARALSKSDQFDFLIDIVPREEGSKRSARGGLNRNESKPGPSGSAAIAADDGLTTTDAAAAIPDAVQAEGLLEGVSSLLLFLDYLLFITYSRSRSIRASWLNPFLAIQFQALLMYIYPLHLLCRQC